MSEAIPGYTIQVYIGGSREMAFKMRNLLYEHYPSFHPEVQYKQPNFTVRIGKFLDRLEGYKLYLAIKKLIPQAIIRPTYFPNEPDIFKSTSTSLLAKEAIESQDILTEEESLLETQEGLRENQTPSLETQETETEGSRSLQEFSIEDQETVTESQENSVQETVSPNILSSDQVNE